MRFRRDPLANPEQLISMVHRYVSYRVGDGAEAEDITSDVFERAIRYRDSYDPSRGEPRAWLIGIARRSIAAAPRPLVVDAARYDPQAPGRLDEEVEQRMTLRAALAGLSDRDQELLALRYGADLTARQIGELLDLKVNAVEVSLHRALARLREILESEGIEAARGLLASL
jgi:RNA polymerase sigma factor (sigma-70 family)